MSIVIIGDIQIKEEQPFYDSLIKFVDWFSVQPFNNENNIGIFLGDLIENSKSNGAVNYLLIKLFNNLKFKKSVILQGNHDYSKRDGLGLEPLKNNSKIEIIDNPIEKDIEGKKCLFLPYFYPEYDGDEIITMRKAYESFEPDIEYDYVFYHFEDETICFGKKRGIDISHIKGKRIGGHIHKEQSNYIGSVSIGRKDEKGKNSYIYIIEDTIEKILIPRFLDYVTVDYETLKVLEETKADYLIYDIINAPSEELAKEKFSDFFIREVTLKEKFKTKENSTNNIENKDIKDYFYDFIRINKLNKRLSDKLFNIMNF